MTDEIKLDEKDYISSKRASELSEYAQDYIGQLARKGFIEARRVGGLWYVSLDSLNAYKSKSESHKTEPPERNEQAGSDAVSFDGKHYVSAARASKLTGYNQDYVGQLARGGKILSRQVGNRWYVDLEGISAHKKEKDGLLAALQSESVGILKPSLHHDEHTEILSNEAFFTYMPENNPLLLQPFDNKEESVDPPVQPRVAQYDRDRNPVPIRIEQSHVRSNRVPVRRMYRIKWIIPGMVIALVAIVFISVDISNNSSKFEGIRRGINFLGVETRDSFAGMAEYIEMFLATQVNYVKSK